MATSTQSRNKEKTSNWSNIFPNEQVTPQQSALFVKKLLAVAISSVTYLRAVFPEHAFGDRCLEDLNLKILRDDSTCPGACQVIKWVKGCFDALDKKYLRQLIIGIYMNPEYPETVIESYNFKFSYCDQGGIEIYRNEKEIASAHNAAETKKATIRLLRTIVLLTQTLESLPDDVMMTMKLLYYDEVTPVDYEPPGFKPAAADAFKFEEEPMNVKVGDVVTPFHTVKLRIKTDAKQFSVPSAATDQIGEGTEGQENHHIHNMPDTCHPSQSLSAGKNKHVQRVDNEKTMTGKVQRAAQNVPMGSDQIVPEPHQGAEVPVGTPSMPEEVPVQGISSELSVNSEEDMGVRCPCGCNEDDGMMILCAKCKYWQHGICFKILKEEEAPENHFCDLCGNQDDVARQPTDPFLCTMEEVPKQAACLWRRTLLACTESNRIIAVNLSRRLGVELTVAQGLLSRLEKEGYIKTPTRGKRLGKIVIKGKLLDEGFKKYLQRSAKCKNTESQNNMDTEDTDSLLGKENLNEMEFLESQTEKLTLSGRRNKVNSRKAEPQMKSCSVPNACGQEGEESMRKGRKRAYSIANEEFEIELSNSQEQYENNTDWKRRKASVAAKAVMV